MTELPSRDPGEIQGGWEQAYAQHRDATLWQDEPIPIIGEVVSATRERGLLSVVDLGCGDGRNLAALAAAGFFCAGVDLAPTALTRAYQRLTASGLHAFLMEGDVAHLPFGDHSVDVLTCFDLFGQLPNPSVFLTEARRVLVDGGLLILNAFTPGDSEFGIGQQIADRTFRYKDTLFRFYEREELAGLFADWQLEQFRLESWVDPPHGEFRPYEHTHENWIVFASP